jgi:hypothetical protein
MGRTKTLLPHPAVLALVIAAAFVVAAAGAPVGLAAWVQEASGLRFYPDDPVWVDDDRAFDASGALPTATGDIYDFVEHTFLPPVDPVDRPALNVNTLDEVPDSSWFTNRIGRQALSREAVVRGPDRLTRPDIGSWPIVAGKAEGKQPGYRVQDPDKHLWQIEFDPPAHPEMASAAEVIGTAFYHALGYHVVEVYVADIDPARIQIAPNARIRAAALPTGVRSFVRADLDAVLARAARRPDGRVRVLASRFADGSPLGSFRYSGQRPDDPNDVFPHEHRRELRANRVFAAWLNHDDSRGLNSLDMLERAGGKSWVKHYMFDFGSIMGSGTITAQRPRAGNEYIFEGKPGLLTGLTLGLYFKPWITFRYPDVPVSVGRFEGTRFKPEAWKPEYPNPAFTNMRGDDAFWAARIVGRFSNEAIRAIVEKAQYSDPRATDYMTEALIKRRDKVVAHWLTAVNPLVDFALSDAGELTFGNAAEQAQAAPPAERYRVQWARFDNAAGAATDVGDALTVEAPRAMAPAALVAAARPGDYLEARVAALHPRFSAWATPVTVHFRREASGWTLVGLSRLPD